MRQSKFVGAARKKELMLLQITPLADVFMILLVFLLKGLSLGISSITPAQSVVLPEAKGEDMVAETLKVEIYRNLLLFEDLPVAHLNDFQVSSQDLEADGTVRSLNSALLAQQPRRSPAGGPPAGAEGASAQPVTVVADADAPYATIQTVVRTLSRRGYPDLKLLVVQDR